MSRIAELLGLKSDGKCWAHCGTDTNGWFAPGHDYRFVIALLERLVSRDDDVLRGIPDELRNGNSSSCPPTMS